MGEIATPDEEPERVYFIPEVEPAPQTLPHEPSPVPERVPERV